MSEPFRNQPPATPVISWCAGRLLAIAPSNGALLWARELDFHIGRLLLTDRLVVMSSRGPGQDPAVIHALDLRTGAPVTKHATSFVVSQAIGHADLLFFSGYDGTLALRSDASLAWIACVEKTKSNAWSRDEHDLVARDANGRELWRSPNCDSGRGGALAIGGMVAQPDFDS